MKRTAAQGIVVAIFVLSVTACTSGTARTDGGVDADVDAAHDVGFLCATATYYPQYDARCIKNAGCSDLQPNGCGCQCGRCRNTQCALEVCPICLNDGGMDMGDGSGDGPRDGGFIDTGCLDPLDRDGSYLDANWDAVKVLVAKVSEDDISDKYLAWTIPEGTGAKQVLYLVLDTKRVYSVPNCSHIDLLVGINVCDDWLYWINYVSYNGTGPMDVFGYRPTPPYETPMQLTNLSETGGFYCSSTGDVLVLFFDKDYHAKFNFYPGGDFSSPRPFTLYNADKAGYFRLIEKAVVYVVPNPSDEILNTCMRSHDLASGKETVKVCGDGTYITDSHGNRVAYQDWRNSGEFGYGESDIYVYDFDADKELELTHDEFSQWCPVIHGDLVVYQDLTEFGGYEGGPGYLWVYDLATKVRRKIPTDPMDGCPTGMNGRYVSFRQGFSPVANNVYLVDMEKAGVVKDGHVIPESSDGGVNDQ